MSCYCDADGMSDVWTEDKRKARKEYKCSECQEKIEKGDEYIYISSLYDGSWSHSRLCEYCKHDWDYLMNVGHCMVIGFLEESWKEHYGQET